MVDNRNKSPILSIIIPIYNVEKYIGKCLRSIAEQTYKDYEVLMIDDGSTDGSAGICKFFAMDRRFIYAYKENGGVSSARNFGLDIARGKYISFIDSDDYISQDFYSSLIPLMEKECADMCQCQWLTIINESGDALSNGLSYRSRNDFLVVLEFGSVVWDKVFKKDVFRTARFDESLNIYEDLEIFSKILCPNSKLVFSGGGTYFYRIRDNSLSHTFYTLESYTNISYACEKLQKYYNECEKDGAYKRENQEKVSAFEVNAKASMFIQNFITVAEEHAKEKPNKSILFDIFARMQ